MTHSEKAFRFFDFDRDATMSTPESGVSVKSDANPFFSGYAHSCVSDCEMEPQTPTTVQHNLCLNATAETGMDLSDEEVSPVPDQRLCNNCASRQASRQRSQTPALLTIDFQAAPTFPSFTKPITEDYTVSHEIIGIGESGKVMACFSKKDGSKYALKVLRDSPKSRREVHLHYLTCKHEHIVSIIDIYENTFDNVKCLLVVLEYMEGGDLLTCFENGGSQPYSEQRVAEILRQIGSAVQYLHSLGIAHRDLKLENILCSTTDEATCVYKLGDFGFAKRSDRNHLLESPCCTPFYAPPEVICHERYDKSCDMWSLGVVTYILLCGYPPFYSMKGLPFSPGMQKRITSGLYAFPATEWDNVSDAAKDSIRHLLLTDPGQRTSIEEFMHTTFIEGRSRLQSTASHDSGFGDVNSPPAVKPVVPQTPTVTDSTPGTSPAPATAPKTRPLHLLSMHEEVNRALNFMRLGHDSCFVRSLQASGNGLLARRLNRLKQCSALN